MYMCVRGTLHHILELFRKCGIFFVFISLWESLLYSSPLGPSWSWSYGSWIYNYLFN